MLFDPNQYAILGRQALRRDLSELESKLADVLEAIFAKEIHAPEAVADALNQRGVARPSGRKEPWTSIVVVEELAGINASLDEAYAIAPAIGSYADYRGKKG